MLQIIKPNISIDFIGNRKIAYVFSALLILGGIVSLIAHGGPNYGIDFAGGAEALAPFSAPVPIEKVKAALQTMGLDGSVQQYGTTGKEYRILINSAQSESENLLQILIKGLEEHTGTTIERSGFQFEMVGPQVGKDLREKALMAIFFALLFITVYISGRFEFKWMVSAVMCGALGFFVYILYTMQLSMTWLISAALIVSLILFWILNLKYAMGAIVALIHDVLITVGMFSVFDKEFSLPIIAAILTIIGYSLNDTIIVFDRIRENLRLNSRQPLDSIINRSVNQTLSRTILTSGTTLMVVIALFFLGGGIIHDFAFALMVGIGVGTYSSIFVASPILLAWQGKK
jgi:preprotein translocase subunit SecF